ncbi:MAG: L-threonylcarbamoyladenylate synthase [Pseudomonadota bacterium]
MSMSPTDSAISEAARAIRAGQLVAFPTETVYGLGADATNGGAVARVFAAKGRPHFNPLIVHVANPADALKYGQIGGHLAKLTDAVWPGPLTVVVKQTSESPVAALATAGLDTVAIRCPAHPIAQRLIAEAELPLVAPSANVSGHVSATTAAHVRADFGRVVPIVLDGGPTRIGVESTIVTSDPDGQIVLLREGGMPRENIAEIVGNNAIADRATQNNDVAPSAPGQMTSHYAPSTTVVLDITEVPSGSALLAFGGSVPIHDGPTRNLSPSGSLVEAAANLFDALRQLDASGMDHISVMPIPNTGLGRAINDRLRRAAAPKR